MLNLYKNPKGLDIPKTVLKKSKEGKLTLVNIKTYNKVQSTRQCDIGSRIDRQDNSLTKASAESDQSIQDHLI